VKPAIVRDVYLHPEAIELLGKECEIISVKTGLEGEEAVRGRGALAAIIGPTWQFRSEVLDRLSSLLVIGRPGIGVDNIDLQAATERGVAVVNTPEAPTISTAEHTVALMLALAKRHKPAVRLLTEGGSFTEEPKLLELCGMTLGLIGLGRVGKRVARICGSGLGMKIVAFDPYVQAEQAARLGVTLCSDLFELLPNSDFVSLHCPPSRETKGMIDERALAAMKPAAYIINCARGVLLDEPALIAALRAGKIAGAGLDVFDPEPPDQSNPLLHMPTVVATPHTAGFTEGALRAMGIGVAEEVLAALHGVRPANLVNPTVWQAPNRR
jgi:D-3-phosphoglycerate dehydrogenase